MKGSAGHDRRTRWRWPVVVLLAAIVVASPLLWRESRTPTTVDEPAAPSTAAAIDDDIDPADDIDATFAPPSVPIAATPASRGAPAVSSGIPAADLPAEGTPVRDAVSALEPLVEQGRADATHRLAMELVRCQRARNLGSDEVIRERLLRRFRGRNGQSPASDAELDTVAREIERLSTERERCAGIDADMFASRLDLLEKAANAGNTDAMLDYADWGLQDMGGYDSLLRNFDEVARRRTLAAGFLNRALSLGDCRALGVMAEAYAGGRGRRIWVYTANPYLAAVYGEAAALVPGVAPVSSTALNALDPQQQATARDQALRLVQRHCGG